jgi:hypothetical protein
MKVASGPGVKVGMSVMNGVAEAVWLGRAVADGLAVAVGGSGLKVALGVAA